jgi:hypothetical protein
MSRTDHAGRFMIAKMRKNPVMRARGMRKVRR